MDNADVATHLENLDQRVDRIEQILPTLATKEDLQRAIEPLATKEDLRREIQSAIEPLATQEELQNLRSEMNVQFESVRDDIRLLADHIAHFSTKRSSS